MILSTNKVQSYEYNGEENTEHELILENHWNRKGWVIIGTGKFTITVDIGDLLKAIENAGNAH